MWPIFAIYLVIVADSTAAEINCSLPVHVACRAADLPNGFPETKDDFDNACSDITDFFNCAIRVEHVCRFNADRIKEGEEILDIIQEVCDEDSLLYAAVVSSLQCVKDFFAGEVRSQCEADEEQIEKLYKDLSNQGKIRIKDIDDIEFYKGYCLKEIHGIACMLLKTKKKCGDVAMEAFLEIIFKVALVSPDTCSKEAIDLLPAVIDLYKLEEENEEVDNILKN